MTPQLEQTIRNFHAHAVEVRDMITKLDALFRAAPESPVHTLLNRSLSLMIDAVELSHGESVADWLDWWWLECDLGVLPMEAAPSYLSASRTIATIDDLIQIIKEAEA